MTNNQRSEYPETQAMGATATLFVHSALFSSLFLQKFGFHTETRYLMICFPVYLSFMMYMFLSGQAKTNGYCIALFLGIIIIVLSATCAALILPSANTYISIPSAFQLLTLYSLLLFQPISSKPRIIDVFLVYAFIITIAGILQYAAQFVGLKIGAFGDILPMLKPILIEQFFNSDAVLTYGSTISRSNGLFLLEPSTFSQLIVVAVSLEIFIKKRYVYLPVYACGYMVTFSGTGLLSFMVAMAISSMLSLSSFIRMFFISALGATLIIFIGFAFPDQYDKFAGRVGEINSPGTSGYARYAAQGDAWRMLLQEDRIQIGYGPGAFEQRFTYLSASNPVLKLTTDYGMWCVLFILLLIIVAVWMEDLLPITFLFVAIWQLGGALLFPPLIIQMSLICIWARAESEQSAIKRQGRRWRPRSRRSRVSQEQP